MRHYNNGEQAYTVGKPAVRAAVTSAYCKLKKEVSAAIPGSVLYWTADTGNYFDYKTLTDEGCVDLWLDMDYCRCTSTNPGGNADIASVASIVQTYASQCTSDTCLICSCPIQNAWHHTTRHRQKSPACVVIEKKCGV